MTTKTSKTNKATKKDLPKDRKVHRIFFLNNGHCYEFFYKRCLKGDDQYDRYSNERGLNTICLNERNSTKLDTVTFEQKMFICKIVTCKKFD
jgi:hypothetical protein